MSDRRASRAPGRLARSWAHVNAVPGLRKDVAAVAVVVVVGLIVAATIVGKQLGQMPWAGDRQTVRAEFAQAVAINLSKRQDVRVAGVPVGRISAVEPTSRGTAIVSLSIDDDIELHRDATAALRPMNPLNEMYVDLDPGTASAPPLGGAEAIPSTQTTTPTQLDEVLAHLDDRAQSALTNLLAESNVALAGSRKTLPAALGAANGTLDELRPVVTALQQRRAKIATLVTSLSRITAATGTDDHRLAELLDATEGVLSTVSGQDRAVSASLARLPQVTATLRKAMASTSALTGELDPLLANLGESSARLPRALDQLEDLLGAVDDALPAAGGAVDRAVPVARALRPFVPQLNSALVDLRPVTARLDRGTAKVVSNLDNLAAFVYNSAGLTVARDTNGTMVRGQLTLDLLEPLGVGADGCLPLPSYLSCIQGGLR